jgi:hypothetical protein
VLVSVEGSPWTSPPVVVAARLRDRLMGVRPAPFGWGVLLRGSHVHGRGLLESLVVVPIGRDGRCGAAQRLDARRALHVPGAYAMLELPAETQLPLPGWRLRYRPILGS